MANGRYFLKNWDLSCGHEHLDHDSIGCGSGVRGSVDDAGPLTLSFRTGAQCCWIGLAL
jgi:hypothetical protein